MDNTETCMANNVQRCLGLMARLVSRPKYWPQPQSLKRLVSASTSTFWP